MYSGGEYAHKYYSGRRMWGGFRRAAPSLKLPANYEDIRYKPVYPWSVKPEKLVTHHDVMAWHRDWYAGTEFDMTKGLQAGPFGTPDRFATIGKGVGNVERSIALYRTNAVYVQNLQHAKPGIPQNLASVAWYGAGPAHYAPFVPIPVGVTQSLIPLSQAVPTKRESISMNWAVRFIMDVCQIRFDRMHPMVEAAQKEIEEAGDALLARLRKSSHAGSSTLNEEFEKHAEKALQKWNNLSNELIFSYSDNSDMKTLAPIGYPKSWTAATFKDGPPDAPAKDQCPPKCGAAPVLV
jgi:dipeptidase